MINNNPVIEHAEKYLEHPYNSIKANASTIEIELDWNGGNPQVALLDDGVGMDRAALAEALRLGGN